MVFKPEDIRLYYPSSSILEQLMENMEVKGSDAFCISKTDTELLNLTVNL